MKKTVFTYSLLILCALLHVQGFSQDYRKTKEDNSYDNSDFAQSDAHQKYLNSEQEIVEFDEGQWQIIKRSIAEGMSEDYYELVDSGGTVLGDADSPYKQSRKSFKKHWRDKNSHRAKRLPKEDIKKKESSEMKTPSSPVLSNILIVVVVLGLAGLIFFLFFNAPVNKNNRKITQDLGSVIPTEIPKTELELMLERAIKKEDYREAIRVYFIFIIRGLIVKDWIDWEKEKTNISYLTEMRNNPLNAEFESTVSVYEIVWYGQRELTKEEYKTLEPRFENLTKKLDQ